MIDALSEWPTRFSSGSWSLTVLPRSSVQQQRLGQAGLARCRRADQGQRADVGDGRGTAGGATVGGWA
jgi:hypothetical protein